MVLSLKEKKFPKFLRIPQINSVPRNLHIRRYITIIYQNFEKISIELLLNARRAFEKLKSFSFSRM